MQKHIFKLLFFSFIFSFSLYFPAISKDRPGLLNVGQVSGKIIDKDTKKALGYTNIYLKSAKDSTTVTGAISDESGDFTIDKIPLGDYYAEIKFIGYQRKVIPDIHLSATHPSDELGNITLSPAGVRVDEIVVESDRLAVDYQLDKKVINVAQNLSAAGGTAVDALENVPAVEVDVEGNVALRGSSNFSVFINGKPSILSGTEALESIPAETIDNIEIITNPSAKYDPEGMAGIMNIILKENVRRGFNGILNAGIGKDGSHNADILVNYFSGGLSLFAAGDYRHRRRTMFFDNYQESYADTNTYLNNNRKMKRGRDSYNARLGAGYTFTEATSANVEFSIGKTDRMRNNYSDVLFYRKSPGGSFQDSTFNYNEEIGARNSDYFGLNGAFLHKFNKAGHQLAANLSYSLRDGEEPVEQNEYLADSDFSVIGDTPEQRIITSEDNENSLRFLANLDYTLPISENTRFETGYQLKIDETGEVFQYRNWNFDTGETEIDENYSNNMDFARSINSGYVTYAGAFGSDAQLKYMLGFRAEHTDRRTGMKNDSVFKISRFDFFPTFHSSYDINDKNQIAASWSRRIDRPRGWFLEPYTSYIDKYNRRVGNPELEPEYSDNFELNYQLAYTKGSYLAVEGYHRHRQNIVTRFRNYDPETNLTYHTFENINDDYSTGVELMLNHILAEKYIFNISGTYYNYQIETQNTGDTVSKNDNTFRGRFNFTWKPIKSTRLQLSADYRAASITAQGEREPSYSFDLSGRQDLLNNAITVSLTVRDILGTRKWESTVFGTDHYIESRFRRQAPYYMLTVSYRLNNYKQEKEGRPGGSSDEPVEDF